MPRGREKLDVEGPYLTDREVRPKTRGARVSGMDRALQILDHLQETISPDGPYAIAKAIGAPLSTVYTTIYDLVDRRLLQRRSDGLIWLGPRLYHYGLAYAQSLDFLDIATHEMQDLCREVEETVQICGRDHDHMVVLAMSDGPGIRVTSRVGTRVPLNGPPPECWSATCPDDILSRSAASALQQRLSIQISEVRISPWPAWLRRSAIEAALASPPCRSSCRSTKCCKPVNVTWMGSAVPQRGSRRFWAGADTCSILHNHNGLDLDRDVVGQGAETDC